MQSRRLQLGAESGARYTYCAFGVSGCEDLPARSADEGDPVVPFGSSDPCLLDGLRVQDTGCLASVDDLTDNVGTELCPSVKIRVRVSRFVAKAKGLTWVSLNGKDVDPPRWIPGDHPLNRSDCGAREQLRVRRECRDMIAMHLLNFLGPEPSVNRDKKAPSGGEAITHQGG